MKPILLRTVVIIFCLLMTPTLFTIEAASPPYPDSDYITDINISSRIYQAAEESDNWPLTWADDDALYTTFGDGYGFAESGPKLSMGFSKVTGNPPDSISGSDIDSSGEITGDGSSGEKASGILFVDGKLYLWSRNANRSGEECRVRVSSDYAKSWTWADWRFSDLGYCAFLNFGKAYAGARDNYVYMYSANTPSAYNETDEMVLTRVPKDQIMNRNAYEFFNGSVSNPSWTSDIGGRTSVFTFDGGVNRLDVSYNAGIGRYLLTMRSRARGGGVNHFSIYEAPEPWGPWKTVYFEENAGTSNTGWGEVAHIPTKWISSDGKTIHIVYAGDDSFSVKRADLTISGTVPTAMPTSVEPTPTTFPGTITPTTPPVSPTSGGTCTKASQGDLDCSDRINALDLSILLAKFGTNDSASDLDNSGVVNSLDLSILLRNFGQ